MSTPASRNVSSCRQCSPAEVDTAPLVSLLPLRRCPSGPGLDRRRSRGWSLGAGLDSSPPDFVRESSCTRLRTRSQSVSGSACPTSAPVARQSGVRLQRGAAVADWRTRLGLGGEVGTSASMGGGAGIARGCSGSVGAGGCFGGSGPAWSAVAATLQLSVAGPGRLVAIPTRIAHGIGHRRAHVDGIPLATGQFSQAGELRPEPHGSVSPSGGWTSSGRLGRTFVGHNIKSSEGDLLANEGIDDTLRTAFVISA